MAVISLSDAFNDCVDRLIAGQSIDDCLRVYPQFAAALRPLLETGLAVQRAQPVVPYGARARTRGRVMQGAAQMERANRSSPRWPVRFLAAASVLVVFIIAGALILDRQNNTANGPFTVPLPSATETQVTLTPTLTDTPTITVTPSPTVTRRPSLTPTSSPTVTPSPQPTDTAIPLPSPTIYIPPPTIPPTNAPPIIIPPDDDGSDDNGGDDNSGPGGGSDDSGDDHSSDDSSGGDDNSDQEDNNDD